MPAHLFYVDLQNRSTQKPIGLLKIKTAVKHILKNLGFRTATLSILFVNDAEIKKLNRRYLKHNRPTDVMAFSQLEGKPIFASPTTMNYLGDIVISVETAARQAKEYDNPFWYELMFYVAHGIFHLIGQTDKTKKERERMHDQQTKLLRKIGIRKMRPSK